MRTFDEIRELESRLKVLEGCLDIEGKRKEVKSKTQETLAPDFWGDPKAAEAFLKKLSLLKSWVSDFEKAKEAVEDANVLYDFAKESLDESEDETVETPETLEF